MTRLADGPGKVVTALGRTLAPSAESITSRPIACRRSRIASLRREILGGPSGVAFHHEREHLFGRLPPLPRVALQVQPQDPVPGGEQPVLLCVGDGRPDGLVQHDERSGQVEIVRDGGSEPLVECRRCLGTLFGPCWPSPPSSDAGRPDAGSGLRGRPS